MFAHREQLSKPQPRLPRIPIRNRPHSDYAETHAEGQLSESLEFPNFDDGVPDDSDLTPPLGRVISIDPDAYPTKPKNKIAVFKFLTLKEPSTDAWAQFAKQQKAEAANKGAGLSRKKLPAGVPKVNSKWDGLPKKSTNGRERSHSGKRSTDTTNKRSGDSWGAPRPPSTAKSAVTKATVDTDVTFARRGSIRRPAKKQEQMDYQRRGSPRPAGRVRPDSTIQIVANTSTEDFAKADTEEEYFGADAIPETSLFWPSGIKTPDYIPPTSPGVLDPAAAIDSVPELTSSIQMSAQIPSNTSSPAMPLTPAEDAALSALPPNSALPLQPYATPETPIDDADEWPLSSPSTPGFSGRSSFSDASPPRVPTRSMNRQSINSLDRALAGAGAVVEQHQFDGTSAIPQRPISTGLPALRNSSLLSSSKERSGPSASAYANTDSEGSQSDLDAVDIPRSRSGAGTSTITKRNFSRPGFAGQSSDDSNDNARLPANTALSGVRRNIRSFSRPLRSNNTSSSPSEPKAAPMGSLAIIRNEKTVFASSNNPYASKPLNAIPPRFQPGRARVKDSDLDTIAEADSIRTTMSSRRQSYASTINADIPRYRGERIETSARPKDIATGREVTSPTSSAWTSDDDDDVASERPTYYQRSSYYANPANPSTDSEDDSGEDTATEGEETETEADYTVRRHAGADLPVQGTNNDIRHSRDSSISFTYDGTADLDLDPDFDECDLYTEALSPTRQADPDSISLAESTAPSEVSEIWTRTPQERLGLGGRLRKSVNTAPWDEEDEDDEPAEVKSENIVPNARPFTPGTPADGHPGKQMMNFWHEPRDKKEPLSKRSVNATTSSHSEATSKALLHATACTTSFHNTQETQSTSIRPPIITTASTGTTTYSNGHHLGIFNPMDVSGARRSDSSSNDSGSAGRSSTAMSRTHPATIAAAAAVDSHPGRQMLGFWSSPAKEKERKRSSTPGPGATAEGADGNVRLAAATAASRAATRSVQGHSRNESGGSTRGSAGSTRQNKGPSLLGVLNRATAGRW